MLGALKETASHTVTGLSPGELDEGLLAPWDLLFTAHPAPSNPFLSSTWVLQWHDKFVRPVDHGLPSGVCEVDVRVPNSPVDVPAERGPDATPQ